MHGRLVVCGFHPSFLTFGWNWTSAVQLVEVKTLFRRTQPIVFGRAASSACLCFTDPLPESKGTAFGVGRRRWSPWCRPRQLGGRSGRGWRHTRHHSRVRLIAVVVMIPDLFLVTVVREVESERTRQRGVLLWGLKTKIVSLYLHMSYKLEFFPWFWNLMSDVFLKFSDFKVEGGIWKNIICLNLFLPQSRRLMSMRTGKPHRLG